MTTKALRTLAYVGLVSGTVGLALVACTAGRGGFGPLPASDALINLAIICTALWILNQPK